MSRRLTYSLALAVYPLLAGVLVVLGFTYVPFMVDWSPDGWAPLFALTAAVAALLTASTLATGLPARERAGLTIASAASTLAWYLVIGVALFAYFVASCGGHCSID